MNSNTHTHTRQLLPQNRTEIRTQIRKARRELDSILQAEHATLASESMLTLLEQLNAKHVALYLTNDGELDTSPLVQALWNLDIKVYLPRLHPFTKNNLLFLAYTPETPMDQNIYGISEPRLDIRTLMPIAQLDVVITPLVAFDSQGNRMGMGGGYYDRSLANWQQVGSPLPIGLAHNCQQVDMLQSEHWDVPLPIIVTPAKVHRFG